MLTTDRVAGGALVLLALVVFWGNRRLPLASLRNPGPAYMPLALAGQAPAPSSVSWTEWRRAVAIFGVCAFAALALERLGFGTAGGLTLAFLLLWVARIEEKGPHDKIHSVKAI